MSGDKEQEYFSDGLAEEIINALAQIPGLKVIARTSAFAFKDKREDITKIAEALRVRTILEGSVRKSGNRVRITAQLIDASDGSHLWSERYDRDMTDVFAIQDEISQAIADKLRVGLYEVRPLVKRHTKNLKAYNLYLMGRHHFYGITSESLARSKEYFEKATVLDPTYALAWFGLAHLYHLLGGWGFMPSRSALGQCRSATLKALELDNTLAQAHAMLAVLHANEYAWEKAKLEFQRALELGPESTEVIQLYITFYLGPLRRWDKALELSQKFIELDPLLSIAQNTLGFVHICMRQYDLAIKHLRLSLELNAQFPPGHMNLGLCYAMTGKLDEGIRASEMAVSLLGRNPPSLGALAAIYASAGRVVEARKILEEVRRCPDQEASLWLAVIYAALGDIDIALDCLEKAIEEREAMVTLSLIMPVLDPLRSHPRYHALLRKMDLEP